MRRRGGFGTTRVEGGECCRCPLGVSMAVEQQARKRAKAEMKVEEREKREKSESSSETFGGDGS